MLSVWWTSAPTRRDEQFEELPMDKFAEHTRAFVKVEDGCNRRCAYCVIPAPAGRCAAVTRPACWTTAPLGGCRLQGGRADGHQPASYGTDSGTSLVELIEKAAAVPGIERIRLGSLDPDMLHDEDIRRMAAVKKLCPQFHLSLQSGCDKTAARDAPPLHRAVRRDR